MLTLLADLGLQRRLWVGLVCRAPDVGQPVGKVVPLSVSTFLSGLTDQEGSGAETLQAAADRSCRNAVWRSDTAKNKPSGKTSIRTKLGY